MTGFLSAKVCRDEMMMTVCSPETSARPTMNRPRPRGVCSRPGQRCSTSLWLAISGEGMLDDAFPLLFPASAPGCRGKHIDPRPDFGWCAALKMLMVLRKESRPLFFSFHEECGDDKPMDYYNNLMGRTYGTPGADCRSSCLGGVQSNALQTAP